MVLGDKMQVNQSFDNFLNVWNGTFENKPLRYDDFKNSHALIDSLLFVFERLGFDRDAVLAPLPEEDRNENSLYYWDLLPVINVTRVLNYLVSIDPKCTITIMHFLQPIPVTSHSILLMMFNYLLFSENRMADIKPYEDKLFDKTEQVKALENEKNKLLGMLNHQAKEKAERTERMEKLHYDIRKLEEELMQEKQSHSEERQELDGILKENQQLDLLVEQKVTQCDALLDEVTRKRALRVYDADDIRAKAAQAAKNVQEAEEKLISLGTIHKQIGNCLEELQTVKPSLDIGYNLLRDITRSAECLKECESGDLDSDMKEGELNLLHTDLSEVQGQLAERQAARRETQARRHEAQAKRAADRATAQSALHEAEEKDKKCKERHLNAQQLVEAIKQQTVKYEEKKTAGTEEIANIESYFRKELKTLEDFLLTKTLEVEKQIMEKMQKRKI